MSTIVSQLNSGFRYLLTNSHFDFQSDLSKLFVFVVAIIILSFFVNFLLANSFLGSSYRVFVAPGIVVHEFSHALLCILTGAKIIKISLFDKEGGSVTHRPSKIPVLGSLLISFAPFFFGTALIILFAHWLGLRSADLSDIKPDPSSLLPLINSILRQINLHDLRNWLIIYLTLSVVVTMTPSRQDFFNAALALIIATLAIYAALQFTHLSISFFVFPYDGLITLLTMVMVLLILSLFLSIVVFAVSKIILRK